jgi:hypothetical protein
MTPYGIGLLPRSAFLCNVTTRFFQTDIATYENFRGSVAIMARLQTTSLDDQTRVDTVDAL